MMSVLTLAPRSRNQVRRSCHVGLRPRRELSALSAQLSAIAERRGVTLALLAGPSGPVAEVDHKAILDALVNLVANAIDAASSTAQGRVEVKVEKDVDEVGFRVSDNGPGIRQKSSRTSSRVLQHEGIGRNRSLGLMTVKKVVEEHGGRVAYESVGGGGAVFSIRLPKTAPP
ncbi:MAG: ATP-binding protein [Planctomycetota bacterium]